ncbi:DUF3891 family protein [Oculatella sp. LEGE 06141]|uniref:DUF3891 family protein n=2 Tax=Oculatella sp. LEGE 06141 TaxID=1828648 RepID=UPI0030DDB2CC
MPQYQSEAGRQCCPSSANLATGLESSKLSMLVRAAPEGYLCITQPTHAWVSGQLAQAWGNDDFGSFSPWREVCLGAEQHDIGWSVWEGAPTLNAETGHPHHFTELPTATHIDLWTGAKALTLPMGRYAALLVSLHGTGLYERFTGWQKSEHKSLVEHFLEREATFQQQLIATLRRDPHYQADTSDEAIARNRRLVAIWDWLSILLCSGITSDRQIEQVPTANGDTTITLAPLAHDSTQIKLSPWCFQAESVALVFEAKVLERSFTDETAMRHALANAPWVTLTTTLLAG